MGANIKLADSGVDYALQGSEAVSVNKVKHYLVFWSWEAIPEFLWPRLV